MSVNLTIEITNKLGLHARAASKLVKLASQFDANIEIEKGSQRVDCKSIMGVMMLAASCGTEITLYADGNEAQDALDAISNLINRRFEEDE